MKGDGMPDRKRRLKRLAEAEVRAVVKDTVRTLVATLRHEIGNSLESVLGAAYLMRNGKHLSKEQVEAARLVETSGRRIQHVLDQLCKAVELEPVKKGGHKLFHIPGDKPWGKTG